MVKWLIEDIHVKYIKIFMLVCCFHCPIDDLWSQCIMIRWPLGNQWLRLNLRCSYVDLGCDRRLRLLVCDMFGNAILKLTKEHGVIR